ncbi:hypothetical protein FHL15_006176 [Xylaria flabelliformis]|uniref:Uncharacterized protein n=1 Tax=Xylaria flabelliformis TaxID=2512241 RepID=A0A553HYL4_9PEZI|nr:hypothetical protein FHL15_006176 [Xylaria flabelliformis]
MVSPSHELHLLKSNAVLIPPTDEKPYHQISVTSEKTGCSICIAATKPLPTLIDIPPSHSDFHQHQPKPAEWVSVSHVNDRCGCAPYSKQAKELFAVWRHIHLTLRHEPADNASYAFYPEFEYETGEALAHASLTASLALGEPVPECYNRLIRNFGTPKLRKEFDERNSEGNNYANSDDSDSDYDSDDDSIGSIMNFS